MGCEFKAATTVNHNFFNRHGTANFIFREIIARLVLLKRN
ncbi:MAG: hypothetical protein JWR61_5372 [Ferruginibacter sp.]|nr:hypothetical protein [Ferruginibacter sp.]